MGHGGASSTLALRDIVVTIRRSRHGDTRPEVLAVEGADTAGRPDH
jgi:hypothetical protein